jgi:hypothetical protein
VNSIDNRSEEGERFRIMAERIDHNIKADYHFGGAAVIVPPAGSGIEKPIELLILDDNADPAQFLSTIVTRIQIMLREIEDRARLLQQGFGR